MRVATWQRFGSLQAGGLLYCHWIQLAAAISRVHSHDFWDAVDLQDAFCEFLERCRGAIYLE